MGGEVEKPHPVLLTHTPTCLGGTIIRTSLNRGIDVCYETEQVNVFFLL